MRHGIALLLACGLAGCPAQALAYSAVFAGDPVNGSGVPYEILPGFPLRLAGPDGHLGTADDVSDATRIGDIDLVVRSGSPAATPTLPSPTTPGARPVGVAGPASAGGTPIAFTVFLSDGVVGGGAPAGHLLAAADMNGLPVVVAAFPDLDGDGVIGPSTADGTADDPLELRELEPVGRGVALFAGGVARGRIAVRAGLPPSRGGLTVVLVAMALTGPYDAGFFGGIVPTGPAIATAMPFVPERDLSRLVRDRPSAVGPDTTLQQLIRFAAVPDSPAFALPVDGSVASVDAAIVHSQPATRASLRPDVPQATAAAEVRQVALARRGRLARRKLRLVAVDRWGNPADAPADFLVRLQSGPAVTVRPSRAVSTGLMPLPDGTPMAIRASRSAVDGATDSITLEQGGVVLGALACAIDRGLDARPDTTVPSGLFPTLQAAVAGAVDRNRDGNVTIVVQPGLYRENVTVSRSVTLRAEDPAATVVSGDGTAPVVRITAGNATVRGLGVVGGGTGFALEAGNAVVADSRTWRNQTAGVLVSGPGARLLRTQALDNGGDGLLVGATAGMVCTASTLADNLGAGIALSGAQNARIEANTLADNVQDGVLLTATSGVFVIGNQSVENLGAGIALDGSSGGQIAGNLCAANDSHGLKTDQTSVTLVTGNILAANQKYGLFVRRSSGDDFAAAAGVQPPIGDNTAVDNVDGPLFVRLD